ncbi:MFS transporter [Jongsikchunia kroppenstedtii]|uniref:MFS transporter n=1 Tax=Jongsikchunia kroppenstedtii TaxID=1121721 RepID=UPI000475C513|nr:MFS transporter [Jongsikchunia kroppenstedtii]
MSTNTLEKPPILEESPPSRAGGSRRWWVLAVLSLAQLMIVLDATIVNIALPAAQHSLGFGDDNRQWIVTAYALAFGSLLLLGGKLTDFFGVRNTFLVGLVGFAGMSALGGAATGFGMLVTARAGQGLFGALLAPAALSLLATTFVNPAERAKAFGIFGAIAGGGGGLGLLLGGMLTDWASWRWTLFVNLFIAAIALVGVLTLVAHQKATSRPKLDLPGTVAITLGLSAIVFGFSRAETSGWSAGVTIGSLIVGVLLVAGFGLWQQRSRNPLLPLRILLDRTRGAAFLVMLLAAVGIFGVFLFLTYYMQVSLGYSPVKTGLAFMPMIGAIIVTSTVGSTVVLPRTGPRPLMMIGMLAAGAGMALLTRIDLGSAYTSTILPALVVIGAGMGFVFGAAMQSAVVGVDPHDSGVASAAINVMQQVGGSVGTALLSTISASAVTSYLQSHHSADAAAHAAIAGYHTAFWVAAGIFFAGSLIAALLTRGGRLPAPVEETVAIAH